MPAHLLASVLHASLLAAADPLPTAAELGTVCYDDGTSKPFTVESAVWLAKMIHGEAGGTPTREDAEWMLWALVQRSAIWSFRDWGWQKFIQGYSQPINPIWTRTGSKCRKYYADGYSGSIPDSCAEKRLERREKYIALEWDDTHATARKAVKEMLAGKLANVDPGIVGWFAPGTWRSREKNGSNDDSHHVYAAEVDGNVYFEMDANPDTTGWTASTVTIAAPGASCPAAKTTTKTKTKPSLGSCETDYGYHKTGKIIAYTFDAEGYLLTMAIENAGWADRICDDATGMVYVGDATDAYVTDPSGTKLRFRVTSTYENAVAVKVIEGKVRPKELGDNKRVVLRKKK